MKMYRLGDVIIKVYENQQELESSKLEGCRSLCPNKMGKPVAVEIICPSCKPKEGEWLFCHFINQLNDFKLVMDKVV
ncbi:hypothetical protein [Acidianus bottle-shaped virus]|uniref:Uncharacterized protein ORF76 n=1 Tax=Acidianus bottle-shaped virus (isolate Italy/Pozzuoli) TaxID=654911 RepID=Y076_ABVP|nr:hypothetical protein ABV_gp14 [Acidianus bottle-shaped virus]A4ZUA0.1 RecName: Full=Uncharacterized protein ORF76 [Acidianus bottle-shaped virus (isolate Pozzuoli)]ABP73404.1 hypothetical protein [Acidianus bottle-shaped virus]